MNVYLYQPDGEQDNNITFYMPHATNGVIVYLFKAGAATTASDKTRLVSGYENGRSINTHLSVGARKDAFVLSCVRAPRLFRELFVYNKFTSPIGLAIVRAGRAAPEAWHVLGMRRRTEVKRTRNIKGLRVHSNSGPDRFYHKALISLAGNVPANFIRSLQRCRTHYKDINVLNLLCKDLLVDDSPVQLDLQM
ncbi:orf10 peptide [Spilosoma obliqua nucleopolyhedrosis virus]|uniref:ORF11 peptide n=1 Tax=Hyphantria cunea nuclear polyhedrosis virus TaxID=28288 RepID=Q2NNT6_NPVHC|nr:ORF11 peptide [Hyphantria cunea nucleopolyhedrovirus]AUR45041.1 orf10 peptide [Spilosoma obliqua nucleopolyhedrosis virus]BAE72300.1 ORF11 peptide [Hyphantria cunea nucleopolyhedrovirus]